MNQDIISVGAAIASSLLIVWLLLPTPTLPLTKNQLSELRTGQVFDYVWPKLTKKQRAGFLKLANERS